MQRDPRAFLWDVREAALAIQSFTAGMGAAGRTMKSIYFENDDILQICLSDKPIVREVSLDWHTHISYAEDETIVEVVFLDAKKEGLMPLRNRLIE